METRSRLQLLPHGGCAAGWTMRRPCRNDRAADQAGDGSGPGFEGGEGVGGFGILGADSLLADSLGPGFARPSARSCRGVWFPRGRSRPVLLQLQPNDGAAFGTTRLVAVVPFFKPENEPTPAPSAPRHGRLSGRRLRPYYRRFGGSVKARVARPESSKGVYLPQSPRPSRPVQGVPPDAWSSPGRRPSSSRPARHGAPRLSRPIRRSG
jgi:hypothetical protein